MDTSGLGSGVSYWVAGGGTSTGAGGSMRIPGIPGGDGHVFCGNGYCSVHMATSGVGGGEGGGQARSFDGARGGNGAGRAAFAGTGAGGGGAGSVYGDGNQAGGDGADGWIRAEEYTW
jgi:hypothetical protein